MDHLYHAFRAWDRSSSIFVQEFDISNSRGLTNVFLSKVPCTRRLCTEATCAKPAPDEYCHDGTRAPDGGGRTGNAAAVLSQARFICKETRSDFTSVLRARQYFIPLDNNLKGERQSCEREKASYFRLSPGNASVCCETACPSTVTTTPSCSSTTIGTPPPTPAATPPPIAPGPTPGGTTGQTGTPTPTGAPPPGSSTGVPTPQPPAACDPYSRLPNTVGQLSLRFFGRVNWKILKARSDADHDRVRARSLLIREAGHWSFSGSYGNDHFERWHL